jgi:hypothetical protein
VEISCFTDETCGFFHRITLSYLNALLYVGKNIYHLLFNIQIRNILSTHCICMFHMILRTNSDHFLEQHIAIGLRNGDAVCLP